MRDTMADRLARAAVVHRASRRRDGGLVSGTHEQTELGVYSLGLLDLAENRRIERHLRHCADCRRILAELNEVRDLLGTIPATEFASTADNEPTDRRPPGEQRRRD